MKAKRRILLYGNSIIIGTIEASLRRFSQFEVIASTPRLQEVREIEVLKPDVVFFDLEATYSENVFSLIKTNPNLVLLGISPDVNLVKVWSGRQLRELSTQDLIGVINDELNDLPAKRESPDMAVSDLSMGNEDTRALLDALHSCSVPVRVCQMQENPETVKNAVTAEERGHITKSEARKVARTLRDVMKGGKGKKPNATDALDDN